MTRSLHRSSDYITRAECQALIVHTLNQVFAQVAQPETVAPAQVGDILWSQGVRDDVAAMLAEPAADSSPTGVV